MGIKAGKRKNKETAGASQSEKSFEFRFNELKQFKERFNHCNVPQHWGENPSLGIWVGRQRENYKKKGHAKFYQPRIEKLNSIGFNWVLKKRLDLDVLVDRLIKFKQQFGHCDVPQKTKEYHPLGMYVNQLRWYYKKKDYQKLPEEKIEKLNSIGFHWVVKKRTIWQVRFKELKEFNEKYGRFNKFVEKDQDFVQWVIVQRKNYKKGKLSQEHYYLLNSIGFFEHSSSELKLVLNKYKNVLRFGGLENHLKVEGKVPIYQFIYNKKVIFNKQLWEPKLKKFLLKFSNDISRSDIMNCMIKYEKMLKIREIERQIKCPINTIQKTIRGTKPFPVKWEIPLKTFLDSMANDLKFKKNRNISG